MNFNITNGAFEGRIIVDTQILQPTVVFYSTEYWYPSGYTANLVDTQGASLKEGLDFTLDSSETNYAKFLIINHALNGQVIKLFF
jgi:hypothetical protein